MKGKIKVKKSTTKVIGSSPLVDILCVLGSPPEGIEQQDLMDHLTFLVSSDR